MPAPDYENDLVFPPRHDKTALELKLENEKLKDTVSALESELKTVCDVLIRVSPKHEGWVMNNWKHLYEV